MKDNKETSVVRQQCSQKAHAMWPLEMAPHKWHNVVILEMMEKNWDTDDSPCDYQALKRSMVVSSSVCLLDSVTSSDSVTIGLLTLLEKVYATISLQRPNPDSFYGRICHEIDIPYFCTLFFFSVHVKGVLKGRNLLYWNRVRFSIMYTNFWRLAETPTFVWPFCCKYQDKGLDGKQTILNWC